MKRIERILAAVRFDSMDRLPKGEFYLEDEFITELLSLKKAVTFEDRAQACELCGLDALAFSPLEEEDENNRVWKNIETWRKETDFFIFAIIDGPFQGTAKLFSSFTDYLLAIAKSDPIIPDLISKSVRINTELGLKALVSGANGIIVADDIAYKGGTFISPKALKKDFFPGLKKQVHVLKEQNPPVFFHADGDLLPVMDDLLDSGINGLHSLDFSSLEDITKVRMATEHKLCLMGGYDLGWFEAENRIEKALELIKAASLQDLNGGYIFGSSAGILGNTLSAKQVLPVYQWLNNVS
ncbi:Uroporphyrinogen decarboxylase (URO-D) [Desulfosporosinus orientis DSM 765]|uniref:Uroporphyrinogen decarboxylase (URO-D) n=1 Tax=Desulfosporosinus orientis (strain ATCC 19365 / DSM 765 / NCIMB 8382 / VKM B-1628 / Singapore I) TaxID=768706 RepID=G7WAD7_DESOD|nr:uroporphyrinogen decarboxylase family protein [Desulfosporosinus orientis]AET66486.1 Uroporphyrinogen decarboxylase (URO-D) [Desulfosporosinus orientis DSM 765]